MTLHPLLGLALGVVLVAAGAGTTTHLALADDHPAAPPGTPTQAQVAAARQAALGAATDVDSVRAALVVAGQRLESAQVDAASAGEALNGARFRAAQARQAARVAERRAARAASDVDRQREAYADTVTASLQLAPELTAVSALTEVDGIDRLVDELTTLQTTTEALDGEYDSYRATGIVAAVARQDADRARVRAVRAQAEARRARDAARQAAGQAAAEAGSVAAERDRLITRLARLQHVSVDVARRRQHGLEVQAALAAQQAAQQAAEQAAQEAAEQAAQEAAEQAAQEAAEQAAQDAAEASASASASVAASASAAATPTPSPAPTTSVTPTVEPTVGPTTGPTTPPTDNPPPSSSDVVAAIAFARQQIGEPYVYGAAGPGSWDCSGLTMGAWQAGGISLPHYSVAQYEQSTPIGIGDLRPGDLVFWGSSSSPGSIFHVAMYTGNGMIIQAPRTGRTVYEGSMYDWRTPDFFARP